jgi:hypothetical protein
LAGGSKIEEVCKGLAISPATCHLWQEQHGGADLNTVKELKALREENAKSRKLVADLPDDLTRLGRGPLAGTATLRPAPPAGVAQHRLTFTAGRKYSGIQGPRHWLRTAPDGSRIAFLMRDEAGVVQLWTVSPNRGAAARLTRNGWGVASTFTWRADGRRTAHAMDNSARVTDTANGRTHRLTERSPDAQAPRPEACVFAPDLRRIAYVRRVRQAEGEFNQVFVAELLPGLR